MRTGAADGSPGGPGDRRPGELRIVDFSTHLPGPLASHLLAELGATVIKVEHPRFGDGNRATPPLIDGVGMFHGALNSGTRSMALDLRSPRAGAIIAACGRWADAVIVGARPKDARPRGYDFATLRQSNPRIIYCSISGFGDRGPWSEYTAHGQTVDALAGLVPVQPGDPQPSTAAGWRTSGTTLGGMFAAMGVLAAVRRRDGGWGDPQYLSVSLWAAAVWWSWRDLAALATMGAPWIDYDDLGSRYSMYYASDRRVVLVCPIERRYWERFCDLLDLPEPCRRRGEWEFHGMEYGAGPDYADERRLIAGRIAREPREHWIREFERAEIPFAPVLTLEEAMSSEHAGLAGVFRETTMNGRPIRVPAAPIRLAVDDADPALPAPLSPAPGLGEHSEEILRELGVREEEPKPNRT